MVTVQRFHIKLAGNQQPKCPSTAGTNWSIRLAAFVKRKVLLNDH